MTDCLDVGKKCERKITGRILHKEYAQKNMVLLSMAMVFVNDRLNTMRFWSYILEQKVRQRTSTFSGASVGHK